MICKSSTIRAEFIHDPLNFVIELACRMDLPLMLFAGDFDLRFLKVTGDLDARLAIEFRQALVVQVLLVLVRGIVLNEDAEVLEFLRPFEGQFDREERRAAAGWSAPMKNKY